MAKSKTTIKRTKTTGDKLDISCILNFEDGTVTYVLDDEEITKPILEVLKKQYDGQDELEGRLVFEVKDSYEVEIVD